jgi:hypothetical protein
MNIFTKATSLLKNKNDVETTKVTPNEKQPRYESVLKQRTLQSETLENQQPGLSQTQEMFAKEWRKSNNLKAV